MAKALITLLLISAAICAHGQTGGEYVYPFLNICVSSDYAAMGGYIPSAYIAGPGAAAINPALPDSTSHNSLSMNMVSYVADIKYTSALYSRGIRDMELSCGAMLLSYGDFALTDEAANELGTFTCRDAMIIASASRSIIPNLRAGVSAKLILSSMEAYKSQGATLDAGLFYRIPSHLISMGLTVRNLGKQITTYNGIRESLPLDIRLGISKQLMHAPLRFSMTFHSIQHPRQADNFITSLANHIILGAEIFPDGVVGIRGGFDFRAHNDLYVSNGSPFPGFSFGVDVRLKRFSIQYSRQCISPAGGANIFTADIFINKFVCR